MNPCPVCGQPDGFHDTDEEWGERAHSAARARIPAHLRRPSNTQLRRERRDAAKADPAA